MEKEYTHNKSYRLYVIYRMKQNEKSLCLSLSQVRIKLYFKPFFLFFFDFIFILPVSLPVCLPFFLMETKREESRRKRLYTISELPPESLQKT